MPPLAATSSKSALWTGRILTGIAVLFLAWDTAIKLLGRPEVAASLEELGYPTHLGLTIGIIELLCLVVYLVPATSVLGAILLTGYLGGAIATHLRLENPLFTHVLFPTYIAALIWGGLYLRDVKVRNIVALRG